MTTLPATDDYPRIAANGIELSYDRFGDPQAPALLLIMGFACQMLQWDEPFCEQLAARGYHVIRFDNRDIGQSTWFTDAGVPPMGKLLLRSLLRRPTGAPYLLADMAADSVGLLDALGIEQAHIVGASMGGMIAQEVALRYPQRVRTLTSIMSTTSDPWLPPAKLRVWSVMLKRPATDRAGYIAHYARTWQVLRGPGRYPEDEARDLVRAGRLFARGLNPSGVARQLAAIVASGSRRKRLHGLKTPTLVIHGNADPLIRLPGGVATARAIPGARLQIVVGMGHALPERVWPEVLDGIAKHAV